MRREKREPLQYIIGETAFYKELYRVTPDCLIPRQDTELLVEYAVNNIPEGESFLDLCTGSGCIAISTLKNTVNTSALAIDISPSALKIARENAVINGVSERCRFIEGDVLRDAPKGEYYAILSNPPYVSENAYKTLQKEIYYEPRLAFVADDDGMKFYERILDVYRDRINPRGFFAFEIGFDQEKKIKDAAIRRGMRCEILYDLSYLPRVAVIKK